MAKRARNKRPREAELVGHDGALCAAFVNTATATRKTLDSYADLLAWAEQNGALSTADAERLERAAVERPADAGAVVYRARELRDLLERILLALAAHRAPDAADIDALNVQLGAALSARRLVPATGVYRWDWAEGGGDDLDRMLWPVLLSAADVLSSEDINYVRACDGRDCELLFVDRTPGRHRRWCSKKACGNRARALRRYHARVKQRRAERRKREGREMASAARQTANPRGRVGSGDAQAGAPRVTAGLPEEPD